MQSLFTLTSEDSDSSPDCHPQPVSCSCVSYYLRRTPSFGNQLETEEFWEEHRKLQRRIRALAAKKERDHASLLRLLDVKVEDEDTPVGTGNAHRSPRVKAEDLRVSPELFGHVNDEEGTVASESEEEEWRQFASEAEEEEGGELVSEGDEEEGGELGSEGDDENAEASSEGEDRDAEVASEGDAEVASEVEDNEGRSVVFKRKRNENNGLPYKKQKTARSVKVQVPPEACSVKVVVNFTSDEGV